MRLDDDLFPAVRAAQDGDDRAFRPLYRTLQPYLLPYLTALVGDEAEDVDSETWLQIVRDLPPFTGRGDILGWATAIARHRAVDHLRQQRHPPALIIPAQALLEVPKNEDTAGRRTSA